MNRRRPNREPSARSSRPVGPADRGRRGRPLKFGRPARLLFVTLPEDVLQALNQIHPDPGWAIVRLIDAATRRQRGRPTAQGPHGAELAALTGGRALILVPPGLCRGLRGVVPVPLADGLAFLMFDRPATLADLEVALSDRLDRMPAGAPERDRLRRFRDQVRAWRRDGLRVTARSILVIEGQHRSQRARPLAPLRERAARPASPRTTPRN